MHNSEEQFRQLANSIPSLAWMADGKGWIYWYNQQWFDYTGTALQDMQGWGWQKVHHPEHVGRVTEKIKHSFENGEDWEDTFPLRSRSGEYRWFLSRAHPIRDSKGNILRWFGINTDITERLQVEETLRINEALTLSILESSPDCIKVLDCNGLLLSMNDSGKQAMEIDDFSTCINRPWADFWPEEIRPIIETAVADARTGKSICFEKFCPTAKGTEKWWEVIVTPVTGRDDGHVDKIVCISRDITLHKKNEAALQDALKESQNAHAQVMEASKRKDEFLANMSHELRTPLNAIVGIGHILTKSSPLSEKQATCIKTLQSSSESLLMLINDLLDLAKLENENIRLENIPFHLHELIEEVTDMARFSANEKKISLTIDYDKRLEGKYVGDPHRLKQILMNLTSNAIKFTERGGVRISVRPESEARDLINVVIHIADTGIGIPAEKLQNIFSKFSQADTSTSRKYGGTGLGLTISKTLAELMGGGISVESCQGVGSEFVLRLPLARDQSNPWKRFSQILTFTSNPSSSPEESPYPSSAPRVLIVEDYKPNLLVATTYMEMFGFQYDTAQNGDEAIRKIQSATYDVVLMDVQMPGMDGLSATRAIREWEKQKNLKHTPIIGITAYALTGDREKCLESGMDDYLSKPFNPDIFKEKITRLVHGANSDHSHSFAATLRHC